ncbi:hypothetical protein [Nonomuraea jabiensis]|uniref:Uncharacterized protein n=1 Tax=Nonomuraea jabiensis TaxID=882448 RepID=A0A7W9FZJ2_9ACTN|nr:hypothetical protein [Nonomuraea jabiensis]MBB5774426.1 hypothetical protein [Nonomuraea jabiensis]
MLPVTKIATGFVVAFGALRFNGFDLLFNPIGWGLCASGLLELRRSADDPFGRAGSFAVAMACISLVATIPFGASDDQAVSFIANVIGIANTAGALITVWVSVDAVIRRIRPSGDLSRAALLDVLRWAVAVLGALSALAGYGYADLGLVVLIAWFSAIVALIAVLYRSASLPCFSPPREPVANPLPPGGLD